MEKTLEFKEQFIKGFDDFEKNLNGGRTPAVHNLRKEALNKFKELSFPSQKDEEWKYTNLLPLLKHSFSMFSDKINIEQEKIEKYLFDNLKHNLLVFINGKYSEENSRLLNLPEGVIAGSISTAIKEKNPLIEKHFGKYANHSNQIFTALSTAFINDGAFISVPGSKVVEVPFHILFLTSDGDGDKEIITQPRNLFIAGKNSQVTIIEHYVSPKKSVYFTNTVTEVVAGENAVVNHLKLQEESEKAFHIARMEVDQERNSNFTSALFSNGANISRNDFNARFNDEGGECTLNGLFLLEKEQLFDAHTLIDHAKPNCNSHEHYKGILDDNSRGVFNGKVLVRPDAQKTNAFQENNNILLSDNALINTKPQLEIFADDVKCSHGATIGQLDEEAKFYLNSRGIGDEAAKTILLHAFASDVTSSIKIEPVRNYLENIISERFNQDKLK